MAFSYVDLVGDGQTSAFSFRFTGDGYGYFRESDIHVYMDGNEVHNWSLTAPNQISFPSAPAAGVRILIRRIMPKDLPYSIWKRGNDFSPLTTNNNFLQQLYALQEMYDGFMTEGFRFNQDLSMGGYKITDLADGVNPNDAVNYKQLNEANVGAGDAAERAKASAAEAKLSETNAKQSENIASAAASRAEAAEVGSAASAQIAATAANRVTEIKNQAEVAATRTEKALADFIPLEQSAIQAAQTASDEATRAFNEAERAKAAADSIDMTVINARLDSMDVEINNVVTNDAIQDAAISGLEHTESIQNADIVQLKEDVKKGTKPMFSVEWWGGKRSAIPAGAVPADGQELLRSMYPDAAAEIIKGTVSSVPVVYDEYWLSNPQLRGSYSFGSTVEYFRVPDYNGKHADSLGAVFLRGDGKNSHPSGTGYIQGDMLRSHQHNNSAKWATNTGYTVTQLQMGTDAAEGAGNVPTESYGGEETRPVNVTGCWIIWLFGSVTNAGSADAAALATAYAELSGRMSTIESRVSGVDTVYIKSPNYTDPYPPTDLTISANEIPSTIGVNTRIIVPNPFGVNESCIAQAELFMGGGWFNTGFVNISGSGGVGVTASYVPGVGVVIQSGSAALHTINSNDSGGSYGTVGSSSRLPVRVKLTRVKGKQ